ncbi:MAG: AMP nucleosidase [Emticicia sp.]|nr:AMP nucleosidase [Emticicia sp.]
MAEHSGSGFGHGWGSISVGVAVLLAVFAGGFARGFAGDWAVVACTVLQRFVGQAGTVTQRRHNSTMHKTPTFTAPVFFRDPAAALAQVQRLYQHNIEFLRHAMRDFVAGADFSQTRVRACYPFVRLHTHSVSHQALHHKGALSYGFVAGPGRLETTLTRPDLYADYLLKQFELLLANHGGELEVGTSAQPIPIHFSFAENDHIEGSLSAERRALMRDVFDLPDLAAMDDGIANGTHEPRPGEAQPLALFTAPRVDYSLQRLRHYTGTAPEWFQNFVLFTNYQFYIDEFIRLGHAEMANPASEYVAFVEPGNVVTRRVDLSAEPGDALGALPPRLPQMPAYHLMRADRSGITLVNIGVGPANAKTITDHIAVLRPHAWLMIGHCAGLRSTQQLGDYVLAHAYVREDHVLDEELPLWVPIPALAEIQLALEERGGRRDWRSARRTQAHHAHRHRNHIQQALRWIRDQYGILYVNGWTYYDGYHFFYRFSFPNGDYFHPDYEYDSPEESELALLEDIIFKLKERKNGK